MGSICPGQDVVAFAEPLTKRNSIVYKLEMASPIFIEPGQSFFSDYNLHSKHLSISSFSEVILCQKVSNQKSRIVKIIPKALLPLAAINDRVIFSLFSRIKQLKHAGLVKLYQVYESKESFYVISQYLKLGSLADLVEDGPLDEIKTQEVMRQILVLADFLQGQGFDLVKIFQIKPENVLIRDIEMNKVVINLFCGKILLNEDCSLGLSKCESARQTKDQRICIDLGLLSWFLLTSKRVSHHSDLTKDENWKALSPSCKDYLQKSMACSISLQESLAHSWFSQAETAKHV